MMGLCGITLLDDTGFPILEKKYWKSTCETEAWTERRVPYGEEIIGLKLGYDIESNESTKLSEISFRTWKYSSD